MVKYLRESYEELKRVQWPDKDQTIRLTGYVIGVSLCVGLLVSAMDFFITKGLGALLIK